MPHILRYNAGSDMIDSTLQNRQKYIISLSAKENALDHMKNNKLSSHIVLSKLLSAQNAACRTCADVTHKLSIL